MIFLLHGPDDLLRTEHLGGIRAALGPPELAELSTTWLEGRKTTVAEVCYHCEVMPFLTARRLVVVEGLIAQLNRRLHAGKKGDGGEAKPATAKSKSAAEEDRSALLAYLPVIADTADLVLIETETPDRNDKTLKELTRLAGEGKAELVVCEAPRDEELPGWVSKRAQKKGTRIDSDAALDLATSVGRNLRLIDNELDKLVAYRAGAGPIRKQDVRLLVPYAQEASVFDMVDAIGQRDSGKAMRLLRELEEDGAAPLYLLSMIVRQIRILVQVSDQMALGLAKDEIAKAIGLHPFPTQKAMQQARQWRMTDLEAAYDRLLETDLAIKTGKLPDALAIDLLVVELSQRKPG